MCSILSYYRNKMNEQTEIPSPSAAPADPPHTPPCPTARLSEVKVSVCTCPLTLPTPSTQPHV